jgi:hypothetical protein
MFSCKLLSTKVPFVLYIFCDVNHQCQAMSKIGCEPLWYGEPPNALARQLNLFKLSSKLEMHF